MTVSASTYNGLTSYIEATVDKRVIPYGDNGSLRFRTRETSGRLMTVQLQNTAGQPSHRFEIQLFNDQLQIEILAAQGLCVYSLSLPVIIIGFHVLILAIF